MHVTERYFNQRRYGFGELPQSVMIETVMGCNLRCAMCPVPTARETMGGRSHTLMSLETFRAVLDEVSDEPRFLSLNQLGEPLLNEHLCEFVAHAKERKHTVQLTTNGTKMNTAMAEALLKAGVDSVTFSIDGFRAATYESIRTGADYEQVRANVESFCALRRRLRSSTWVQIDCICSDLTRAEIAPMRKYWRGKVDLVHVLELDDWGGRLALPDRFGGKAQRAAAPRERYPCDLLWTTISVAAEGRAMYCCHDYRLQSGLPHVKDVPLRAIWRDRVSRERRKHVENAVDSEPCLHCEAWKTRQPFVKGGPKRILSELLPTRLRQAIKKVIGRFRER